MMAVQAERFVNPQHLKKSVAASSRRHLRRVSQLRKSGELKCSSGAGPLLVLVLSILQSLGALLLSLLCPHLNEPIKSAIPSLEIVSSTPSSPRRRRNSRAWSSSARPSFLRVDKHHGPSLLLLWAKNMTISKRDLEEDDDYSGERFLMVERHMTLPTSKLRSGPVPNLNELLKLIESA